MAITVDWGTKIINVPKADTQLVQSSPTEIRQLDIDVFRLTLKDLEDGEDGMPFLDTHSHNPPVTVGGVTLARVVEIINGYTVTFEDGQYAVNLVGANSNIGDVTNVNQVSIRSANSAGLTFSEQINDQSFAGGVWIDSTNGLSGTNFPRGTATDPVDNITDAITIANNRKLTTFYVFGTLIVPATTDVSGFDFDGTHDQAAAVVFVSGSDTSNCIFREVAVVGPLDGPVNIIRAAVAGITNFYGNMNQVVLTDDVTVDSTPPDTMPIGFYFCSSGVPGTDRPTVDLNDTTVDAQFRHYAGGLTIDGLTQGNNVSIDLDSGVVELTAGCTSGTVVVRGVGQLIDNSGAGVTVVKTGLVEGSDTRLARQHQTNKFHTDPTTGVATLYDDDSTTVLGTGQMYEDVGGTQTYRGQGAERREKIE